MKRVNGVIYPVNAQDSYEYTILAKSENAYTAPSPNPDEDDPRGINILYTGNINDESQKNFELLFQSIGMRAVPNKFSTPVAVKDLSKYYECLSGEGYIWHFSSENKGVFGTESNPTELLQIELDGLIMYNGVSIMTLGDNINLKCVSYIGDKNVD